jgi:hypothetical protein
MGAVWYATVEDVMYASDAAESARTVNRIKRALGAATDQIDSAVLHHFYPTVGVKYVDFPNYQYAYPWRIWLNGDQEAISLTAVSSGGVAIPLSSVFLEPADSGPPYDRVEINIGTSSTWQGGTTHQRTIVLTGTFGHGANTDPAGALVGAINASVTSIACTDSSPFSGIGTGQLLQIDNERMIVTRRSMLTTGQTLQTPMSASSANVTVAVTDGTKYFTEETILLDAERMQIVDITGNTLIVRRATDGTALTSHAGSTIYAPRTLTVSRAVLGTTAASHADTAPILKNRPPEPIKNLAIALAQNTVQEEQAAYGKPYSPGVGAASTSSRGRGGTSGLAELWAQVIGTFGTLSRTEAI